MVEVCIVGGFPRAGTRQFTDILNKHSEIAVKGEYYPKLVRLLLKAFEGADEVNENRWTNENYNKWRMRSALNAYAALSKGSNSPFDFKMLKVAGFKSPRAELNFYELKKLIGFNEVVFFYCLRNVKDNFLSENSTFNVGVEDYVEKTIGSMRAAIDISEVSGVAFYILNLDDYISTEEKESWLNDNIFSRLNVSSLSEGDISNFLGKVKNTNATLNQGKVRRYELSDEEYKCIYENKELISLNKVFLERFGSEIL